MTLPVRIEQMSPGELDMLQKQIMARQHEMLRVEVEAVKGELAKIQAEREIEKHEFETVKHRIDNIDGTNIEGDLRDRFNKMIRLFATRKGMNFNAGYREFVARYNTAYRTNLELRMTNYCKAKSLKKITTPEYLEATGCLEDAIRVADKMLNQRSA